MTGPLVVQEAAEDAEVLSWFLASRSSRRPSEDAPVLRWIRVLQDIAAQRIPVADGHATSLTPPTSGSSASLAVTVDIYLARLMAFCVRCIEGAATEGRVEHVSIDASFVHAELAGRDDLSKERLAIPAGVGTLLVAAYCAQLGGSRLAVYGNNSPSLDVEWTTGDGGTIRFEAKSRGLAAGFSPGGRPASTVAADIARRIAEAAPSLRSRSKSDGKRCLNAVVATGFFPSPLLREIDQLDWDEVLRTAFRLLDPYQGPQGTVVHLFGLDLVGGAVDPPTVRRYFLVTDAKPRPDHAARRGFLRLAGRDG